MRRIAFIGLCKIEFDGATVYLCDGGFIVWGADTYRSSDATFGVIGGVETINEGVGEEVPVVELTLLPPDATTPATLIAAAKQDSRVRFWLAEYDVDAGTVTGTPDLQFDGLLDQAPLTFGPGTKSMGMTLAPATKRLIERNIGNSLNSAFHKSIWPAETGHDNADGLGRQVAWGVESG